MRYWEISGEVKDIGTSVCYSGDSGHLGCICDDGFFTVDGVSEESDRNSRGDSYSRHLTAAEISAGLLVAVTSVRIVCDSTTSQTL